MSRLGIVAALPDEAKCLHNNKLDVATPVEIQKNIFLCLSGIGYESAYSASKLLLGLNIDALISWGVAGAIDSSLTSGDLIISKSIINNDKNYKATDNWIKRISDSCKDEAYKIVDGDIASSKEMCASVADKKLLFKKTSALAVDMESAAIAELAKNNNIDFIALRTIADTAETNIPEAVIKHTDNLGKPKLNLFILSCILKPAQIREIFILAKSYQKSLKTLRKLGSKLKDDRFLYSV